jgi:hypothetical protein
MRSYDSHHYRVLKCSISFAQSNKNSQSSATKISNHPPSSTPPAAAISIVTPLRESNSISKAKGFQAPAVNKDIIDSGNGNADKKKAKTDAAVKTKIANGEHKQGKSEKEKKEKENGKKPGKAEKPAKDPHAPKAAKGGYMFFSAHMRAGTHGQCQYFNDALY